MPQRLFKGKRKASPSPSPSSIDDDDDTTQPTVRVKSKKTRLNSPAQVRQRALANVAKSDPSGSSLKGLAGFTALVNNANLFAAGAETSRGLRSGSISKSRGGAVVRSRAKAEKTVSIVILFVYNLNNLFYFCPG